MQLRALTFALLFTLRLRRFCRARLLRRKILQEWIAIEKAYADDLIIILLKIKIPMLEKKLLTDHQSRSLFDGYTEMLSLSEHLSRILKKAQSATYSRDPFDMGGYLDWIIRQYSIYTNYFKCYRENKTLLASLSVNPIFQSLQSRMQAELPPHKVNMGIADFFGRPFNRLFKSLVLLEELKKNLLTQSEKVSMSNIIKQLREINQKINDTVGRTEKEIVIKKLDQLLSKSSFLLQPMRIQFVAMIKADSIFGIPKPPGINLSLDLYICNNLLVITLPNPGNEQLIATIKLDKTSSVLLQGDKITFKNILFLCGANSTILIRFKEEGLRKEAYRVLRKVIDKLKEEARKTEGPNGEYYSLEPGFTIEAMSSRNLKTGILSTEMIITLRFSIGIPGTGIRERDQLIVFQEISLTRKEILLIDNYIKEAWGERIILLNREDIPGKIEQAELYLMQIQIWACSIFRDSLLMSHPLRIVQLFKLSPRFWELAVHCVREPGIFTPNHCAQCAQSSISSPSDYLRIREKVHYPPLCPGLFYLLRQQYLNFGQSALKTVDQVLLYQSLAEGRIDECFFEEELSIDANFPRKPEKILRPTTKSLQADANQIILKFQRGNFSENKMAKSVEILFPDSKMKEIRAAYDQTTTIGKLLIRIGRELNLGLLLDFGMFANIQGSLILLQRSQFVAQILEKCTPLSHKKLNLEPRRNTYSATRQTNLFPCIRPSKMKQTLYSNPSLPLSLVTQPNSPQPLNLQFLIRKIFFFPLSIQLQSLAVFPNKYDQLFKELPNKSKSSLSLRTLTDLIAYQYREMGGSIKSLNSQLLQILVSNQILRKQEPFLNSLKSRIYDFSKEPATNNLRKVGELLLEESSIITYSIMVSLWDGGQNSKLAVLSRDNKYNLGVNWKGVIFGATKNNPPILSIGIKKAEVFACMEFIFLKEFDKAPIIFQSNFADSFSAVFSVYKNFSQFFKENV